MDENDFFRIDYLLLSAAGQLQVAFAHFFELAIDLLHRVRSEPFLPRTRFDAESAPKDCSGHPLLGSIPPAQNSVLPFRSKPGYCG